MPNVVDRINEWMKDRAQDAKDEANRAKNKVTDTARQTFENVPAVATIGGVEGALTGGLLASPMNYFVRPSKSPQAVAQLAGEWQAFKNIPKTPVGDVMRGLGRVAKRHGIGAVRGAGWTAGGLSALQILYNVLAQRQRAQEGMLQGKEAAYAQGFMDKLGEVLHAGTQRK